eukprot:GILJ01013379.1.p1 GENE.GILJ01013379.1~~GILJ01013379.1.p1  ORF type:complete len:321 (+),score=30.11 GILJ01013379.1:148-1110(+)
MSASKDKDKTFLLYGSYGYTGTLVLNEALKRGVTPIIAGRNAAKCSAQAANDGLDFKVFDVNDTAQLDRALADPSFKVVLNCAGPFSKTAQPMIEACIRAGKHYVDITGEIEVFEMARSYHDQAQEKQVIILCGAGFDVVPSDCLAQYLRKRLPTATHLTLGVSLDGMLSKGTAETVMGMFGKTNYVRQDGQLVPVKFAHKTRPIPFHENDMKTGMTMAWGDTSSAFYSTGIPNIASVLPFESRLRLDRISTQHQTSSMGSQLKDGQKRYETVLGTQGGSLRSRETPSEIHYMGRSQRRSLRQNRFGTVDYGGGIYFNGS